MEKRKIRIYHIVRDDKFLDGVMKAFESEERYDNHFFYVCKTRDYKFKWIKSFEKIRILYTSKMVKKVFSSNDYDVIFFNSLVDYHIFNYIPDNKIVIWWAWGFDVYGPGKFINVPLYKPITKQYVKKNNREFVSLVANLMHKIPFYMYLRYGNKEKAIQRIDYFQPVINTDYELMKTIKGFHASKFYYPGANSFKSYLMQNIPEHRNNLIIGNSATPTNNHCDIWKAVSSYVPETLKVIIPISYGEKEYANFIVDEIGNNNSQITFLKDYLPYDEYMDLLDSCSFAVYGVLRQQAMGAIFRCLASGIKLFLYRDSLVYKYLLDMGYVIYAIEDIDENSFLIPLTKEQAIHNRDCMKKEGDIANSIREKAIEEIIYKTDSEKCK